MSDALLALALEGEPGDHYHRFGRRLATLALGATDSILQLVENGTDVIPGRDNSTESAKDYWTNSLEGFTHFALGPDQMIYAQWGFGILLLIFMLIAWVKRWRKIEILLVMWIIWFGVRFYQSKRIVDVIAARVHVCLQATVVMLVEIGVCAAIWVHLLAPFFVDIWKHILQPFWQDAVVPVWNAMDAEERVIVCMVVLSMFVIAWLMYKVWTKVPSKGQAKSAAEKCKEIIKLLTWHGLFIVVGPCLFLCVRRLPASKESGSYLPTSGFVSFLTLTVVPTYFSARAIRWVYEEEQALKEKQEEAARLAGEKSQTEQAQLATDIVDAVMGPRDSGLECPLNKEEVGHLIVVRMETHRWLAFFSMWPLFNVANLIIHCKEYPEKYTTTSDGVFVAILFWCMFWGHGFIETLGPSIFRGLILIQVKLAILFQKRADKATHEAAAHAIRHDWLGKLQEQLGSNQLKRNVVLAAIALTAGAIIIRTLMALNAVICFFVLWGAAISTAKLVRQCGIEHRDQPSAKDLNKAMTKFQDCPNRLAFWIIYMFWSWVVQIPFGFGAIASSFTLLVLIVAWVWGTAAFSALLFILKKLWKCLACIFGKAFLKEAPKTKEAIEEALNENDEDVRDRSLRLSRKATFESDLRESLLEDDRLHGQDVEEHAPEEATEVTMKKSVTFEGGAAS